MSAPPSKPLQPVPTTFNERLNEQLINCLNVQTNVIQNLTQYSQHISIQLFEIKSIVEILSNRVLALQQQQQISQQSHIAPSHYAPPYYPHYMAQPPVPVPQASMPISHPAPFAFSAQQPPGQIRIPTSNTNLPFFPASNTNPSGSLASNVPTFQFSTPTSQTTATSVVPPSTTTPTKTLFPNVPKFTTADTTTKPTSLLPATSVATTTSSEKPATTFPFVFGTNNAGPIFGGGNLMPGSSMDPTTKPETNADDDGDGEDDPYEPEVSFTRIVELAPVDVKTGEEEENVLFCERARLYRFDSTANQMKERGTGEMKILQHKTSNFCRILMRREQVLKICANHRITAQMELKPHQGSANVYLWSAVDFADGEPKHETLCVRFKTDEQAKHFFKVFNEAKEINMKESGDTSFDGKTSTQEEAKSNSNDDDVISIGEVKPSAEQIDRAKKLQLPSTFFLYENKEPCKGCPGCEEESPIFVSNENKSTARKPTDVAKTEVKPSTSQAQSTTPISKTPLGSSENTMFPFSTTEKSQSALPTQSSVSKEEKQSTESPSSTTNIASKYDNKPSIFGNSTSALGTPAFGTTSSLSSAGNSVFGSGLSSNNTTGGFSFPGFGGTTASSGGFQFSTPTITSTTSSSTNTFSFGAALASASGNKPVFGNSPKFSFADLAKQSSTTSTDKPTSNGTEQRAFPGQGSLIFGTGSPNISTKANNNDDDDGGDGGGEDESYEPNVSFKPIVQLSAVEVKTGEEDENVLFCERAKLYRFDAEANQMKERGIGEMKILQHKTTKRCRILMRREQVLKICANHQITPRMELKPHQGTENAYVWSAMDFADGEAKHETLCIRFKTSDLAKRFLKQFNDAKQANAADTQH